MKDWDRVHDEIGKLIEEGVIWGASYGFVREGELSSFYRGVQGAVKPWSERALGPGMFYDLASLTKVTGTAVRILQLIQEGKLEFSTPVQAVLKRFSQPEIKVENLLLHNSGLPAEIPDKASLTADNIRDRLYETRPEAAPGERYCYSDPGFMLLGLMVEELDGTSLDESYRKHIFGPLGLNQTSYHPKGEMGQFIPEEHTQERGWICGEVHDSKAHQMGESGSAGLFSTLDDMLHFGKAWLNQDERLISRELFEKVEHTCQFDRTYGWGVEYGPGTLYHSGFTGTSILMDVETGEGLVLLTNRIHPSRENVEFLDRRKRINRLWLGKN